MRASLALSLPRGTHTLETSFCLPGRQLEEYRYVGQHYLDTAAHAQKFHVEATAITIISVTSVVSVISTSPAHCQFRLFMLSHFQSPFTRSESLSLSNAAATSLYPPSSVLISKATTMYGCVLHPRRVYCGSRQKQTLLATSIDPLIN